MVLKFGFKVAEDETIFRIQSAIVDGKLGKLSVNVSYVTGIPPAERSTTAAPSSSTAKPDGLFLDVTDSGIINVRVVSVCLTYTLFDSLAYNTWGFFATTCVAMRKCLLVLYAKPSNMRFIIPLQKKLLFCNWPLFF